jgi:RecA/RadA recombinase
MATAKKKIEAKEEPIMMRMGFDLGDLLVGGAKGVYGLPFGAILNIIADSSGGKTFWKNEIIAANYHKLKDRLTFFSDDTETGDTFDTQGLYGVDIRPKNRRIGNKRVEDSKTVEEMDAHVSLFLETIPDENYGIYTVDSLDGLSDATKEDMEASRLAQLSAGKDVKDPGDYGTQIARFLSGSFFRTKHQKLEDAKTSLIIVSQIREKLNAAPFSKKWTVSGGKALEFYSHTRVFLTVVKTLTRNGKPVGAYVKATTVKSKTPRPFRTVHYTMYFDYGIDNIGSNLDYLYDLRDDKGELKKTVCEHIAWSEDAKSKTLDSLKDWVESIGKTEECRAAKKVAEGNTALSAQWILQWAESTPELKEALDAHFGVEYTRDQLIKMCEDNPDMNAELTRRVRDRWEREEAAVATGRAPKYNSK